MATQENTANISKKANADLSTKQYLFVKETAANTVDVCSAITDKAIGVLQDKPAAAGRSCAVAFDGTSKVVAGAAITVGAAVAPMASGKAQTAVSTQFPRGIALEGTTNGDGDIIEILLIAGGVPLP
jgi:hypothetical protein